MTIAEKLEEDLKKYYESNGIFPDERFNCKYKDRCAGDFARGMQCHIGKKYGEKLKILVASLDCGGGGKGSIEDRRQNLYEVAYGHKPINLHMTGTYTALSYFLEEPSKWSSTKPSELVDYMVMINTCKCCKKNTTDQMSNKFFSNCSEYTVEEILKSKPQVILFQGKNSYAGCRNYLFPIEKIENNEIKDSVRLFKYKDEFKCFAVLCIHPSARYRYTKKRKKFYKDTLRVIATYIKDSLKNGGSI